MKEGDEEEQKEEEEEQERGGAMLLVWRGERTCRDEAMEGMAGEDEERCPVARPRPAARSESEYFGSSAREPQPVPRSSSLDSFLTTAAARCRLAPSLNVDDAALAVLEVCVLRQLRMWLGLEHRAYEKGVEDKGSCHTMRSGILCSRSMTDCRLWPWMKRPRAPR